MKLPAFLSPPEQWYYTRGETTTFLWLTRLFMAWCGVWALLDAYFAVDEAIEGNVFMTIFYLAFAALQAFFFLVERQMAHSLKAHRDELDRQAADNGQGFDWDKW